VAPIPPGSQAPPIPGVPPHQGRRAVVFYKVTCPTCQMAAPAMERLHAALPESFVAVGQDPPEKLAEFADRFSTSFPAIPDTVPYPVSAAWGLRTVPTLFVLEDGTVSDVVESWDREGWNRAAIGLIGSPVSDAGDGLPPFRPG
jgi:thiol-disulfide isomerase/thioredoxin